MTEKICKNCKWVRRTYSVWPFPMKWEFAKCHAPGNMKVDLVSGVQTPIVAYAEHNRGRFGNCGPLGLLYEEK